MTVDETGSDSCSEDVLLDGRLRIRQPRDGARVCLDTLLLASAVPARPGERVIEAGCGCGAAILAVARRVENCAISGIDIDPAQIDLATGNAQLNGFGEQAVFLTANVGGRPADLGRERFDHAMANPPYFEPASCCPPPGAGRARAYIGGAETLRDWVDFCLDMVRHKGTLTFIHRADRLDFLIAALCGRAGDMAICPVWPRRGLPAKRVIVQARKGVRGAAMMMPGLVLHDAAGGYTPEADRLLRGDAVLQLDRAGWSRLAHPEGRRRRKKTCP